jgi:hypothetical protein
MCVGFLIAGRRAYTDFVLGLSPVLRQTVKTLLTVRYKFIVSDPVTDLGMGGTVKRRRAMLARTVEEWLVGTRPDDE